MINKKYRILSLSVLTIIYLGALYTFSTKILAEIFYNASQQNTKNIKLDKALVEANMAIKLNNKEPKYIYNRAKILLLAENPKEATLKDLVTAQELNKNNVVTLRNILPFYYFLTFKDLGNLENSPTNFDAKYFEITKDFIQRLKNKYPNDAGIVVLAAKYEKKLGLTKEYGDSIKMITQLRPDLLRWHPDLIGK